MIEVKLCNIIEALTHISKSSLRYVTSLLFDRELCSKVLKEALLFLFLFLAWWKDPLVETSAKKRFISNKKISQKSALNGTKNVPKQTKNVVVYGIDLFGLVWN